MIARRAVLGLPLALGATAAVDEDIRDVLAVIEEEGARIIFPNPKVKNGLRAGILIVPATDENLI